MNTIAIGPLFLIFTIGVGIASTTPLVFADHPGAHVTIPTGVGATPDALDCEDTNTCWKPYEVTIDVGGEVTWTNDDTTIHNVYAGNPNVDAHIVGDLVENGFQSEFLNPGDIWSHTFDVAGEYPYFCSVHVWMKGIVQVQEAMAKEEEPKVEGGGCLIATATYGSELAPQVQLLREIRDNSLLKTESGSAFMESFNSIYYSFSPAIADYERENPVFKEAVKLSITPLITSLSILNYVDIESEETVLGYGIGIILLNIGMYFILPVIIIGKLFKFSPLRNQ